MALSRYAIFLAFMAVAAEVTPIEKVIQLIEGMKKAVEDEGMEEAKAYGEFACFCRTTTKTKSDSVVKENHNIDELSADIAEKTQSKKEDQSELKKRKADQVKLSSDLQESNTLWAKELAEYQVEEADYSKAISSLKNAIKAMDDSKPSAAVLLSLRETLKLADAMDMVTAPKHKMIASFLQGKVDPSDPEYKYHSNDILELLNKFLVDFKANKLELDTEHEKAKKAAEAFQASLKEKMGANKDAMDALEKSISTLEKEIAKHHEDLVESRNTLKDDEDYLKDLTARCEARANDFDQRSAMRGDEITAISTALKVLKDEVQPADAVNVRALFLQKVRARKSPTIEVSKPTVVSSMKAVQSVSFFQNDLSQSNAKSMRGSIALEEKRNRALSMLDAEGQRLNSVMLTALAANAAGDPFKKVKGLIQKLIERLLAESRNEATKKGFCDTELGKARKSRDFRFAERGDLSADLAVLEAKEDALTKEIKVLQSDIKAETKALEEETEERKKEKALNAKDLATAKDGIGAVTEALLVLRNFYKQASKASFIQASPVDEDTSGPGFSGSYSGQQSGSKAVLGLLETIQSDFDRTIRTTEAAEEAAHRAFVEFSQTAKSSLAAKATKQALDEQDLITTRTNIKTKTGDLITAMNLLDQAIKEIEELKPTCIDTGMSYKERVQKREEEMEALKKALCILDGEGVEPDCK